MSTNCYIGMEDPKTKAITYIYCHWDGYPKGVGKTLREFYTDSDKIRGLLALGHIESLRKHLGEKHNGRADFKLACENGWTTACSRDYESGLPETHILLGGRKKFKNTDDDFVC